jgi:hypothetical protein
MHNPSVDKTPSIVVNPDEGSYILRAAFPDGIELDDIPVWLTADATICAFSSTSPDGLMAMPTFGRGGTVVVSCVAKDTDGFRHVRDVELWVGVPSTRPRHGGIEVVENGPPPAVRMLKTMEEDTRSIHGRIPAP